MEIGNVTFANTGRVNRKRFDHGVQGNEGNENN